MNLNYILQRKHIFKKRKTITNHKQYKLLIGQNGLLNLQKQRYELNYLRFLKKIIRRRHMRKKMSFKRRKFWLFLHPNKIFTGKSVNSRMGAGTGTFVRLAIILKKHTTFVEFKDYSAYFLKKIYKRLHYRCPLKFKLITIK